MIKNVKMKLKRSSRLLGDGYVVQSMVNAITVDMNERRGIRVGDHITDKEAEELNQRTRIEVTTVAN